MEKPGIIEESTGESIRKNDFGSEWLLPGELMLKASKATVCNLEKYIGMHTLTWEHWVLVVVE